MPVEIIPVTNKREREEFLRFPFEIYRNDPHWVPPLTAERRQYIDPKKNPFFTYGAAQLFLARRDGRVVGRVSAQTNSEHNRVHSDKLGFFGFFESIDDPEVAKALLDHAEQWLRARGCDRIRGPMSFTMNDEVGVLISGFDYPPFMLMGHTPAYYVPLLEACGLAKAKDLFAWRYISSVPPSDELIQMAEKARNSPGLRVRQVDMKHLERDLHIILDIFNDVWRTNWGFVPLTDLEVQKTAKEFKLVLEPKLALIIEYQGEPIAISIAIPNLNEAIKDLGGKLFPFGIFKLLWRVKVRGLKSTRLMLLGIKRKYRGNAVVGGRGLAVLLYTDMHMRSRALGHWGGELGWTLENNDAINVGIAAMGGTVYKIYRVFEKAL